MLFCCYCCCYFNLFIFELEEFYHVYYLPRSRIAEVSHTSFSVYLGLLCTHHILNFKAAFLVLEGDKGGAGDLGSSYK